MKMNVKLLRNILCVLLTSFTVLTLFGCTNNKIIESEILTESNEIINATNGINHDEVKDYQIIQVENEYRLVFDDPSFYANRESPQIVGFHIDTWEDFSNRLLAGTLTLDEKTSMYYTFGKDEQGVFILNPYISYKISHFLPHQIHNGGTYAGKYYATDITCDEQYTIPICINIQTKNLYNKNYEDYFADIYTEEKNLEYEKELSNNDIMRCYNKTVKKEHALTIEEYILSNDDKNVFVSKTYNYDYVQNLPYELYVLVNIKNEIYFSISFSHLDITQDLTDEFLFGFNVEVIDNSQTA